MLKSSLTTSEDYLTVAENQIQISLDFEDYVEMLEDRRAYCYNAFGWEMPDCVWNYAIDVIRECGVLDNATPKFFVDNLLVNSDYCLYDDVRDTNEDLGIYEEDAELEERLKDEVMAFVEDENGDKYVIYSL